MNKATAPHTSNRAACFRDAARTSRTRAAEAFLPERAAELRAQSDTYEAEAARLQTLAEAADFEVHGRPHTLASAEALLAELEEINASHLGPSDGRVTTIAALEEAIAAHKAAEATARVEARHAADKAANTAAAIDPKLVAAARPAYVEPTAEEIESAARLAENIRKSRAELAGMERGTPGVGRIQYVDKKHGVTRVARYTTRDGFLRGYIRMATAPNAYGIMFVDEN